MSKLFFKFLISGFELKIKKIEKLLCPAGRFFFNN